MVTVKIITKTYFYSKTTNELYVENIEVIYARCGFIEAMDLIEECNTNLTEDENYRRYKSGDYRFTTTYATL